MNTSGPTGLLSRRTPAARVFYTFDPHGNVAQRTDASGNVLSSSVFDAFGNKLSTEAQTDPWEYGAQAGYYTDVETGLILCTHPYYEPTQGRYQMYFNPLHCCAAIATGFAQLLYRLAGGGRWN